jgi:hypothetical protein
MKHPSEMDLAVFAGGECSFVSKFLITRHVRACPQCTTMASQYQVLRGALANQAPPELDWSRLEPEMRANIRLGLEAGECVRLAPGAKTRHARLAVAFASLMVLAGAGILLRNPALHQTPVVKAAGPVLESSGAGLELRNGTSSMTLMNRTGSVADQTVSAQGEIRARYVDGGSVTINNVYLE